MQSNELLNAGLLISAATYIGYQLKSIPETLWVFIKRKITYTLTIEETDELYIYMERWLTHNYKDNYRNVEASLSSNKINGGVDSERNHIFDNYDDKIEKTDKLHIWQYSDVFILKYGKRRLLLNKGREKLEGAKDLRNAFFNRFTVSGLLAKKPILKLLNEVIEYNQQFKNERLPRIYSNNSWGEWEYSGEITTKNIDNVFFEGKDCLINDLDSFFKNRNWYLKRGVTYKRGYIFYGLPGNGKTATVQAIAKNYKKDVYYASLTNLEQDSTLPKLFTRINNGGIIVFEDVDVYFNGRKNNNPNGVSFSMLLNCLDGAFSKDGTIVIMTTNHVENLDSALIRPGRIDVKLEISNPKKTEITEYLKNFYEVDEIIGFDDYTDSTTSMVKIQDICLVNKDSLNDAINLIIEESKKINI
jgi:chaperone BCS1